MIAIKLKNPAKLKKKIKRLLDKEEWSDKIREKLDILGKEIIKGVRARLLASGIRNAEGIAQELKYEVRRQRLLVVLPVKYAPFLNYGTVPRQMLELEGKTIPIKVEGNRIIFRVASRKSMAQGKWKHPGIQAAHFWENGIYDALKGFSKLLKTLPKEITNAL